MLLSPELLIDEFSTAAEPLALAGWPVHITGEILKAPHQPPKLPAGVGAVYAFALCAETSSEAGAGMVLKVGKVGPNSAPRFRYQHYGLSVGSSLAKSILSHRIVWPWLGIEALDESTIKGWMLGHLDRLHLWVPGGSPQILSTLEMYVRARVGSVFEGSA